MMSRRTKSHSTRRLNRKSAPKVVGGLTQRKNRLSQTHSSVVVVRDRPGRGYRHYVTPTDVMKFVELIPDWNKHAQGLEQVVLATGNDDADGWYNGTVIAVCAQPKSLLQTQVAWYAESHRHLYERLGIGKSRIDEDYLVQFTPESMNAFLLLHVFLHELGHHIDRMTCRPQKECSRGESFAEGSAYQLEKVVTNRYSEAFGFPIY